MNVLTVTDARKKFGTPWSRSTARASSCGRESCWRCSVRTAPARRRSFARSPGACVSTAARSGSSIGSRTAAGRRPSSASCRRRSRSIRCSRRARTSKSSARCTACSGADLTKQVDWALEQTGLADRASEPVKQFSGGMRRRLNIACGVLHRPRIVLLDEPTVGVDPQSRDRIYDMLAGLAQSGVSLLLTTHHLEEAEARCSRTVIIDHGKVIAGRHAVGARRSDGRPLPPRHAASGRAARRGARGSGGGRGHRRRRGGRRVVKARMRDVALELPPLLERIRRAGRSVDDVECAARACRRSSFI